MNYKEVKVEIKFMIPEYLDLLIVKEKIKSFIKALQHAFECKKFSFSIFTKESEDKESCQENWKSFP